MRCRIMLKFQPGRTDFAQHFLSFAFYFKAIFHDQSIMNKVRYLNCLISYSVKVYISETLLNVSSLLSYYITLFLFKCIVTNINFFLLS